MGTKFGSGCFQNQSPNSPRLRLALRVLRYASQRNCDLTLKTQSLDRLNHAESLRPLIPNTAKIPQRYPA